MKEGQKLWTKEDLILAINLYIKLPFGKMHRGNADAGHIVKWSQDKKNRLNPKNGLLLNALHDRAFEHGLLTIDEDYKVKISSLLKKLKVESFTNHFGQYDGRAMILLRKFLPDKEFLKIHNAQFKA